MASQLASPQEVEQYRARYCQDYAALSPKLQDIRLRAIASALNSSGSVTISRGVVGGPARCMLTMSGMLRAAGAGEDSAMQEINSAWVSSIAPTATGIHSVTRDLNRIVLHFVLVDAHDEFVTGEISFHR